jgi:hypothetical protein
MSVDYSRMPFPNVAVSTEADRLSIISRVGRAFGNVRFNESGLEIAGMAWQSRVGLVIEDGAWTLNVRGPGEPGIDARAKPLPRGSEISIVVGQTTGPHLRVVAVSRNGELQFPLPAHGLYNDWWDRWAEGERVYAWSASHIHLPGTVADPP